jgi:2-iminobutanoate/2-iminopropanoate deaminase
MQIDTFLPDGTPEPIGPYSHVARAGGFLHVSGTAGVDPATGRMAGPDAYAQAAQILRNFRVMLQAAGSDLQHILHVNVFLKNVDDFEALNQAYREGMGTHRPARTVVVVADLPKRDALMTMNCMAVAKE